jgi:hypothetical protein
MQSTEHQQWFQTWAAQMGSNQPAAGGGRIDVGPVEALGARPGRQTPKRNSQRSRVPAYSAGQTRKL